MGKRVSFFRYSGLWRNILAAKEVKAASEWVTAARWGQLLITAGNGATATETKKIGKN